MRPDFESGSGATSRGMKSASRACAGVSAIQAGDGTRRSGLREGRTAPE
jgi:hypothetical protein